MRQKEQYAPEETIGFLLWDTMRSFTRNFSNRIEQHGVSFGLWPFLRALWEEDGLTQRELSERVRMKGSTTVAAINRLEQKGLVRRVANKKDARKINVFLTAKGRETYDRCMPEVETVNTLGLSGLSPAEQDQLKSMLKRLRANMVAQ